MTGTDSNDDITQNDLLKNTHSTVAKANVAAGPSALSAFATVCASSEKAIMDEDDQTLATLDALKKKSTKKASDNLFDTNDEIPKKKWMKKKAADDVFDTDDEILKKKWTKKKRCPVDLDNPSLYGIEDANSGNESSKDDDSVSSEDSGGPPPLVLYCSSDDDSSVDESGDDRDGGGLHALPKEDGQEDGLGGCEAAARRV